MIYQFEANANHKHLIIPEADLFDNDTIPAGTGISPEARFFLTPGAAGTVILKWAKTSTDISIFIDHYFDPRDAVNNILERIPVQLNINTTLPVSGIDFLGMAIPLARLGFGGQSLIQGWCALTIVNNDAVNDLTGLFARVVLIER